MSDKDKETLLTRWSRRKRESARTREPDANGSSPRARHSGSDAAASPEVPARETAATEPLPRLPRLDELGPDSDFGAFMDPRVDEDTRRAALKTLFRSPAFNISDGLDVYAEDYSKLEKLTPAMVAALRYAQRTLFDNNHADSRDADSTPAAEHSTPSATNGDDALAAADDPGAAGAQSVPDERGNAKPEPQTQRQQADERREPLPEQKT